MHKKQQRQHLEIQLSVAKLTENLLELQNFYHLKMSSQLLGKNSEYILIITASYIYLYSFVSIDMTFNHGDHFSCLSVVIRTFLVCFIDYP